YSFYDGLPRDSLSGFGITIPLAFIIIDMKTQYIFVVYGMRDSISMQTLLENIFSGFIRSVFTVLFDVCRIGIKDWRSCKAKKLCLWKKFLNGLVVIAEL